MEDEQDMPPNSNYWRLNSRNVQRNSSFKKYEEQTSANELTIKNNHSI